MRLFFVFSLTVLLNKCFGKVYLYSQTDTQWVWDESLTSQLQETAIFPDVSWSCSIEYLVIGLLILLTVYMMLHSEKVLSHEKLGLVLNMVRKSQTPLTIVHHLLEDIASDELSESASNKLKRALGYTTHIMNCYQNVIALDDTREKTHPVHGTIEFELYTYITSIASQCQAYANMRQIQLNISKNIGYISCQVNEITMTAALQCLLNKVIDATPCEGSISIMVSHFSDRWSLRITNYPESEKDNDSMITLISTLISVHCCGSLRIIRKIIHLHGGKITGSSHGQVVAFQVVLPKDCHYDVRGRQAIENSAAKSDKVIRFGKDSESGESKLPLDSDKFPHVLLVMADKELSDYLNVRLSLFFRMTILEDSEEIFLLFGHRVPDVIILDETVNGVCGGELCSRIKLNADMSSTPVILLISSNDNQSYLTHIRCGADKLEPRMVSVCKLKADIGALIDNHIAQRERVKRFIVNNPFSSLPEIAARSDESVQFMDKVQRFLEENLSTEGYTVDMLSADAGMSRTGFYNRIKEITGKPPMDYMHSFKMDRAKVLLITQQYSVTEIATLLGYCDAKYFGKKFKEFYHVSPTRYVKEVMDKVV